MAPTGPDGREGRTTARSPKSIQTPLDKLLALALESPPFPSLPFPAWRRMEKATQAMLDSEAEWGRFPSSFENAFRCAELIYLNGDECAAEEIWRLLAPAAQRAGRCDVAVYAAARVGRCASDWEEHDEAMEWYRMGLAWSRSLPPGHPARAALVFQRGTTYKMLDEWDKAKKDFLKGLQWEGMDPELTMRWEGMEPEALRSYRSNSLIDLCLDRLHRDPSAPATLLGEAASWLEYARRGATTPRTRALLLANEAELAWQRGELREAFRRTRELLSDTSLPADVLDRYKPWLYRLLAMVALEQGELSEAQLQAGYALDVLGTWRYPYVERVVIRDLLAIFTRKHQSRYGGYREDAVLGGLAEEGGWVFALVDYMESRDVYLVPGHGRAVAAVSKVLGEAASALPAARNGKVDRVYLEGAALLHDIGKLKIAWSLLNRTRPLTPIYERRFQRHVVLGARILEDMGFSMTARLLEEHHERADGSGYPSGLRELSLAGGLLALSEALVDLCSRTKHRRPPLPVEAAVAWCLGEGAGGFHPVALEALELAAESGALVSVGALRNR